eukprot:TRINITY_DN347_c0_g1_i1.p1 TRINITY_DN347_c0_g1~~TRINITY_DN347_c0_g1_i1.p1  ORF type:complete len:156 (-),score=35.39 TRINITY_DN347_c0_g1_i1:268-735(-)
MPGRNKVRTNTAAQIRNVNGEAFGVLHAHKLTGYKAPNAYGHSPAFSKHTTYSTGFKAHLSPHGAHKELCPYDPNSMRSRLPVTFADNAKAGTRFCRPRNVSQYQLVDPNTGHTDARRFVTINRSFHKKLMQAGCCTNGAVLAERTKAEHMKIWT